MTNWGRLGVFDLETTGVDVETSRIVSACVAILEADGTVVARWDWLADPIIEIPEGASAVHGITTDRAREDVLIPAEREALKHRGGHFFSSRFKPRNTRLSSRV